MTQHAAGKAPNHQLSVLEGCTSPQLAKKRLIFQVKLHSSDDQTFEVQEDVAFQSETIKNMIEGALRPLC